MCRTVKMKLNWSVVPYHLTLERRHYLLTPFYIGCQGANTFYIINGRGLKSLRQKNRTCGTELNRDNETGTIECRKNGRTYATCTQRSTTTMGMEGILRRWSEPRHDSHHRSC